MTQVILSIDQGTTSSRTLVFSLSGEILFSSQEEFPQIYPQDGWVEHDPEAIWSTVLSTLTQAYDYAVVNDLTPAAIGITNQRETTVVWDRKTGETLYNAIVWQDRRTSDHCKTLAQRMPAEILQAKTGLLHDPYFSGSKMAWILDNVSGARARADAGELCFGTVDSFLIWRLTGGASHVTDATNASRTNLFDIHKQDWDEELLELFEMKLVENASETETICEALESSDGVYLVAAFTGLGAPHWAPDARAAVFGMTRNTNSNHFIRATVESVVYQTNDLFDAMARDGVAPTALRVDGGMAANSWMCGYLSDILDMPVLRPKILETTALGAAYLAGLGAGLYENLETLAENWVAEREFTPTLSAETRETRLAEWSKYVQKLLS